MGQDPDGNTKLIAQTFREACTVAEGFGERLAAEGEICWAACIVGGRWSNCWNWWTAPNLGFQPIWPTHSSIPSVFNAPETPSCRKTGIGPIRQIRRGAENPHSALRPWTIDFHVAQNDATVLGRARMPRPAIIAWPRDTNGKLDIPRHAGYWLRDAQGQLTRSIRHVCWDGCMFPNAVMMQGQTWNDILRAMMAVRQAHGWN